MNGSDQEGKPSPNSTPVGNWRSLDSCAAFGAGVSPGGQQAKIREEIPATAARLQSGPKRTRTHPPAQPEPTGNSNPRIPIQENGTMPHHYSAENQGPSGQTIMLDANCRGPLLPSTVARSPVSTAGRRLDRLANLLRWTQFAGDAGTLFENLRAPLPEAGDKMSQKANG